MEYHSDCFLCRNYLKNTLKKNLGQQEVFGFFGKMEEKTEQIYLNNYFPSFTYTRQRFKAPEDDLTYEDKNIPINLTLYHLPAKCSNASENSLNLILLMKYASGGLMRRVEGSPWISLIPEKVESLVDIICQPAAVTHMAITEKTISFVVLINQKMQGQDRRLSFTVSNQRDRLTKEHRMSAMNKTIEVSLSILFVSHSQEEVLNRELMLWLYARCVI